MVYRDFITMLFIGVLSFHITPISMFRGAIVSGIQKYLLEGICCKIYIVYRDFITTLGTILSYKISHLAGISLV